MILFPVLGNQLFAPAHLGPAHDVLVVMCEDRALCTYVRHHKIKLVLMLAAMRAYADELREAGFDVHYEALDDPLNEGLPAALARCAKRHDVTVLRQFPMHGRTTARRIKNFAAATDLSIETLPDPMFMNTLDDFDDHCRGGKKPHMARYYRAARERHNILLDGQGGPAGGRWSFDEDNRKALPRNVDPPPPAAPPQRAHVRACAALVAAEFPAHPGAADGLWLPSTRADAQAWFADFLNHRFERFGPYEDALSQRSDVLFHSVLSPLLNLGLLTPAAVLDAVLQHAREHSVPMNSVEGFVRQVLGWREFVYAIYVRHGATQARQNFWGHNRGLTAAWYEGTTGLPPLDEAIDGARDRAWNHHIQRLMVIGNVMTLAGIHPRAAYRWFMEMYADAYGWVMEPNVYGMALFSDGGIFATKPYICGANYWLKMGDYGRGDWCDTIDGLYWHFIHSNEAVFASNPRLKMALGTLGRMDSERRARIFAAAARFIDRHTTADYAA